MKTKPIHINSILPEGIVLLACLICIALLPSGCVREDVNGCVQYSLSVKVVDTEGNDITTSGTVTSVKLYLFDQKGFVRIIPEGTSTDFLLGEEYGKSVTLVAWGNLKMDSLQLSGLTVGTSLKDARVQLLQRVNGNNLPSTDLFYSRVEFSGNEDATTRGMNESTATLVLERMSAAVSIKTYSLSDYFGQAQQGEAYRIVVRGAGNALNFLGNPTGGDAGYEPDIQTSSLGDLYAPAFRVFPTESNAALSIDLYKGEEKIFTTSTDDQGDPLQAPAGKQIDVNIDFSHARVKVSVKISDWDQVGQDTQM
ncbi:FimB/Mfa2 family fimbrial subunit [uncultured Bacteroides sp.]|uniref:FimB/Mfa2 family fimbrial subunit n=1 Tax=uncultured Bacteroides sp. TaxID=162156 RepID=UPI002AAB2CD8|nr:FimB/Mfa2 family fimbrial subunit [uncultured Bacteroides sp.]